MSIEKQLLEQDVKDKKNEQMTPAALHMTRDAYMIFRLDIFRQRIYQEVRRQKFIFYLELKQVEKKKSYKQEENKKGNTSCSYKKPKWTESSCTTRLALKKSLTTL